MSAASWFCCKPELTTSEARSNATTSGGDLEELGVEGGLGAHVATVNVVNLPLPKPAEPEPTGLV